MNYGFSSGMTIPRQSSHSTPIVGWRFHPTHEELVTTYLKPKMLGYDNDNHVIGEVNFCKLEPWDLPCRSKIKSDDRVWYFFCPRDLKYSGSRRSNRTTKAGYWKPTGKRIPVKCKRTKEEIGVKKTLVFYKGRPKGVRTGWIMHEYEWIHGPNLEIQGDFVLCKLKKKPDEKTCNGQSDHQITLPSECCVTSEYRNPVEMTTNSNCVASESSQPATFDVDNESSSELTTNSACDESRPSHPMASDLGNQNPSEMVFNSFYEEGDPHHLVFSDLENQNPNENSLSTYYGWPVDSDLENQISLSDFEAGSPFDFNSGSPYDKGETSSVMGFDFENQNQDNNFDISTSREGDWSSLRATPSEFDYHLCTKTDMSTTDKSPWSLLESLLENDAAEDLLSKVSPEQMTKLGAELKALIESESSCGSVYQSPVHQAPAVAAMVP